MAYLDNNQKWLDQMRNGSAKVGCNLNLVSQVSAEMIAYMGYDFVMIDSQHAPLNRESLIGLLQAIKLGGAKSFIRLEGPEDRAGIQQAFDCGVDGILCPFIRNADDVRKVVDVAKYPGINGTEGTRSLYYNTRKTLPAGAGALGMLQTYNQMNRSTMIAVQIETKESIDHLDEIMAVPGLDIAFLGPGDLASSMGVLAENPMTAFGNTRLVSAIEKTAAACVKHGVIAGCWAISAKASAEMGFRFMCVGSDIEFMRSAAAAQIEKLKEEMVSVSWKPKPIPVDPSDV